jgi:uncharacterized protein
MKDINVATFDYIKQDPMLTAYLEQADRAMVAQGYTEHGFRHAELVAAISANIMRRLSFPERQAELAGIAGYLHDIGCAISRSFHGVSGALIVKPVLEAGNFTPQEIAPVLAAIGNHEEDYGWATSEVGAALILADKSDVHRSRVSNPDIGNFDIHDRVNYAAERSFLRVENERGTITLEIDIDTKISQVMEYFEIFLSRMIMCRRAAEFLDCKFSLRINNTRLL